MRIQHNILAMNAYRNYNINTSAVAKNLEKLSSGYKINRAGDDAAGLAISEKMRAQITGLDAATKNVKDGISLVKTAEGAMQEIQDMLNRMDYLATQSANGTYDNEVDRDNLQKEVDQLRSEIDRIADSSNFNGIKLLDGSLGGKPSAIKIEGVDSTKVNAVAGKQDSTTGKIAAFKPAFGDSFGYSVSLDNGKSYEVQIDVVKDEAQTDGKHANLVDRATGKTVGTIADVTAANCASAAIQVGAIVKALKNTGLADNFAIAAQGTDQIRFTSLNPGLTTVPNVNALEYSKTVSGTKTFVADAPTASDGVDEGYTIAAADITLYDGTNKDDAIFTINGKKFVVMSGTIDGATDNDDNKTAPGNYQRAVAALGSDVNVLISDGTGKGLATDGTNDTNFNQNIALIKKVTGLDVVADGTTGIKLSIGSGKADKGLTLQIGDTADKYNQLDVSINDCHCKAIGIADISIANQESAATAIDAIKGAINYVSSVRGTLGATQNRLEHTSNNLSVMKENIQDAESTIRDTDIAEEMMSYTKNNILVQSAQAMLAQANQIPQGVLQLLG